jgi:hypothetical protein
MAPLRQTPSASTSKWSTRYRVVLGSIFITMFDRGMGSKVAPAVKI